MSADLHIHTTFSDGSLKAQQVVTAAKKTGLTAVAITDHDTGESAAFCRQHTSAELTLIPGVEISTLDTARGRRVHLLYYYPSFKGEHFAFFEKMAQRRNEAASIIEEKLQKLYPAYDPALTRTYQAPGSAVFKAHIGWQLVQLGYTGGLYNAFYHSLFGKGGSCTSPVPYMDVWDALALFKSCGGAVVLAHPSVYQSMDLAKELVQKGLLDGIEVEHPHNLPKDKILLKALAEKNGLIVTGGSDFHGAFTGTPQHIGKFTVSNQVSARLLDISLKRNNNNCE